MGAHRLRTIWNRQYRCRDCTVVRLDVSRRNRWRALGHIRLERGSVDPVSVAREPTAGRRIRSRSEDDPGTSSAGLWGSLRMAPARGNSSAKGFERAHVDGLFLIGYTSFFHSLSLFVQRLSTVWPAFLPQRAPFANVIF